MNTIWVVTHARIEFANGTVENRPTQGRSRSEREASYSRIKAAMASDGRVNAIEPIANKVGIGRDMCDA